MRHATLRLVAECLRHPAARSGQVILVTVAFFAFGFTTAGQTPVPSANRSPLNAEEFDRLFQQVNNWGRWGADDQLGSVNLITAEKRKQASPRRYRRTQRSGRNEGGKRDAER